VDEQARRWIERLELIAHPEGGYYRETYRSTAELPPGVPEGRAGGGRACSTAIYYLLPSEEVSTLHRLRSDELFHHYAGSTLSVHVLYPEGRYERIDLGRDPEREAVFQALVPAGCWFGATVEQPDTFALVGCTVAPGFDFEDFEQGRREDLLERYPGQRALIERLTSDRRDRS
jgi:predicted cupin superfamily sugar epimerase